MKRYVKNLIAALMGRNPYREELDEVKERYEQAADNVRSLQDMYYSALEKWTEADRQAKSLQALTENLRERIREKDEMMEQMREEYQQRIRQYVEEMDGLRRELKLAKEDAKQI
ncbi:MAG: hypothetical protein IJV24_07110 [Prevotella sp.]|nr:hypothetical protein [Prevotella sp.]